MDSTSLKTNLVSNILVRIISFVVLVLLARFAYVITVKDNPCSSTTNFCFFFPEHLHQFTTTTTAAATISTTSTSTSASVIRRYYASVFQDLIAEGYLSPDSKSLCIETLTGQEVEALRDIGVSYSIGISKKRSLPSIRYGVPQHLPFADNTFDFEFSDGLDRADKPVEIASEASRTLKPGGFIAVHTLTKDSYSLNSLIQLFISCTLLISREIDGFDSSSPLIREVIFKKESEINHIADKKHQFDGNSVHKCAVPWYKRKLIVNAEPLIPEEPLKPWITLKRNIKNVKYFPSMVDISFKNRYVYVDVGARSYGSSIGSWFKKLYPKQNKPFEVYAIEADKNFYEEYKSKNKVTLLPYAAWVRNETLFFEITRQSSRKSTDKDRGMGRIQSVQSSGNFAGDLDMIRGFDFAAWLKNTFSERDYLVVKMDVEGTEFHLIKRLIETGAICLIDEMFLECHYNRWQRCCPGQRSPKYQKTYAQCLELFSSLREIGVLVHQWW